VSQKRVYRNTFTLEVLSEEPGYNPNTLDGIEYDITDGLMVGMWRKIGEVELVGPQAVEAAHEFGTDIEWFNMDKAGNDLSSIEEASA